MCGSRRWRPARWPSIRRTSTRPRCGSPAGCAPCWATTRRPRRASWRASTRRSPRSRAKTQVSLALAQRDAVAQAARNKVLVITGGPGVGKTTIVRAILALFDRARLPVRLAAPTGRAAKRMSEATGREAVTLHRLLEFDPKQRKFGRQRGRGRSRRGPSWSTRRRCSIWRSPTRSCRRRPTPRASCWWATSISSRRWGRARCCGT